MVVLNRNPVFLPESFRGGCTFGAVVEATVSPKSRFPDHPQQPGGPER